MYVLPFLLPAMIFADFLQRPTLFMYTMNLTSAWDLLVAMKFGSSTLAHSRLLATVGLLTGHSEGVIPDKTPMSLSRNVNEGNKKYK